MLDPASSVVDAYVVIDATAINYFFPTQNKGTFKLYSPLLNFRDITFTDYLYFSIDLQHPCSPSPYVNRSTWPNAGSYRQYQLLFGDILTVTFDDITNNNCAYKFSSMVNSSGSNILSQLSMSESNMGTPSFAVDTNPLVVTGVDSYATLTLDASMVTSSGTEGVF